MSTKSTVAYINPCLHLYAELFEHGLYLDVERDGVSLRIKLHPEEVKELKDGLAKYEPEEK